MKLRCRQGDFAVVIYDTVPCVANLGRIVEVRGPVRPYFGIELPSWLIKPAQPSPYVVECGNEVNSEIVEWSSGVRHPDAWLLPLLAADNDETAEESTDTTQGKAEQASKVRPKVQVAVPSMNYRPRSYFGIADLEVELLGRVKGVMRREALKDILDQGGLTEIPDFLTKAALDDVEREMSGRRHPMFMGGEYLPTVKQNEAEIARISIKSTTYDVTSVYARRVGQRIHYRVVDEYGSDSFTTGVDLYLHQQGINTTITPAGKALFQIMGVLAEFEREMIRQRVRAGIARAKAKGTKSGMATGRPHVSAETEECVRKLRSNVCRARTNRAIGQKVR